MGGDLLIGEQSYTPIGKTLTRFSDEIRKNRSDEDGAGSERAESGKMRVKNGLPGALNEIQIDSNSLATRWIKTIDVRRAVKKTRHDGRNVKICNENE
jgi:hypothetical protein